MRYEAIRYERGKYQEMQSFEGLRQDFIIASQTAKARYPAASTLDNPTTRQQDKAFSGFGQLNNFRCRPIFSRPLLRLLTSVTF
jgi:hypothetical protein